MRSVLFFLMSNKVDFVFDQLGLINLIKKELSPLFSQTSKIILFGSLARQNFTVHSDIDVLIVSDEIEKKSVEAHLEKFLDLGISYDIVLMSEEQFELRKKTLLVREALREGIVLWEKKKL